MLVSWRWGDNTLQDIENLRDAVRKFEKENSGIILDIDMILSRLVEITLKREINSKQQDIKPSEKEKL